MRLLLVQPAGWLPLMDKIFIFEPLALEYLGAGAGGDGHEVRIIDMRLEPDLPAVLDTFRPEVVGITGFTSQVPIIRDLAAKVKERLPRTRTVVGGHHATVCPRDFDVPAIDFVVVGEGVSTLRELLRALENGANVDGIPGLAIPAAGGMTFNQPRPYPDLDTLPLPDRSLTARYRKDYFSEWFRPLASVRTSIGCTARCTFCSLWRLTEGKYLRRDPEKVVAELKDVAEENVFFCDDESMCDTRRMARLADLIREAGIRKKYFLYARVDTIVRHPDLFRKWAEVGLVQVFVGMEDFSETRLAAMNKGISTADQERAARILEELGIIMYASFMIDPEYSRDDFRSLKAYIRHLRLRYATFAVKTPLPGTELHSIEEHRLLSRKPELYDMLHALVPTRLSLPDFYAEMADLYAGAIPLRKVLPSLLRFGLHGMLLRIRLLGKFLEKMRAAHLDY